MAKKDGITRAIPVVEAVPWIAAVPSCDDKKVASITNDMPCGALHLSVVVVDCDARFETPSVGEVLGRFPVGDIDARLQVWRKRDAPAPRWSKGIDEAVHGELRGARAEMR